MIAILVFRRPELFAIVVAIMAATALCILAYILQRRGHTRRKMTLSHRPALQEDEWFQRFLDVVDSDRELVAAVLARLACAIGIQWTQLRPDDRFDLDLRIPARYAAWEDLEDFEDSLTQWCRAHEFDVRELEPFEARLGDFLARLLRIAHRARDMQGRA